MNKKNDFEYIYSAPTNAERKEIESIRNSYLPHTTSDSKLDRLRYLDNKVKNIPTAIALIIGIISSLTFGTGLTMILEWKIVLWGIIVSIIGLIPTLFNYNIFLKVSDKMKNKYSKEILKLSDELLNDENTKH